ncbi:MAG: hypothetical protein QG597_3310 [Actinomycetota bacterium]|nr:hypothetical protein [Actinomycetota bacterium]
MSSTDPMPAPIPSPEERQYLPGGPVLFHTDVRTDEDCDDADDGDDAGA